MKLVIHNSSRVWGGNEKWLATLAAGLISRGHAVTVSCLARGPVADELRRRGIPVTAVRPRGQADVVSALMFARWLRRERPHAVLLTSWKATPLAALAARMAGVTRVVARLGIVRPLPRRGQYALAFRRWVHALIVNSAEIRDAWLASAPDYSAERVHLLLNGVPERGDDAPATLRLELGIPEDALLVGAAGSLTARKGFDLLLDAFAAADVDGAHVVIAGAGEELQALQARAAAHGIAGRVHWLGHRGDVPDVLAACDVFVLSSRNEGMANVMLEAMAAGTPVIATEVSGVREALGAADGCGPAGWMVPVDDAAALAAALSAVLGAARTGSPGVAARVAEARRRVRERFGVERMIAEAERILFGADDAG